MIRFTATIQKFDKQGEKTGWTYVLIPAEIAQQLKPGNRRSFRVKGKLDKHKIEKAALLPMGEGDFILPINNDMRKGTGKTQGMKLEIHLEEDKEEIKLDEDMMACLADEPDALRFFNTLAPSHQKYFSKWIQSAKTEATRSKRIAHTVTAMCYGQDYGTMLRSLKQKEREREGKA